ncbi:hypothetical protein [Stenotrophomonas maltophilia]|uniref:hypothetical protein n=1 Tax=Stenotrophomonas maltophilia TaxID=40324 RepID=UPI0015DD55B8|nr:hypothetical protein [Stenotrophomonas maltophilia]MBA0361094.1 hypothetical protein [Stenotrophomonas maltophilia]HEL5043005.1 hypothetical protein [Stenotrophomonas maltophilia]
MPVRDEDLRPAGPWPLGINNVAGEGALPTDENGIPRALREANNVDLDAAGRPQRRRGHQRFRSGALTHSLWSHEHLQYGLFVDGGQLHALHEDERAEALGIDVGLDPLSYALIGDRVFFNNSTSCGVLDIDLQGYSWSPEHPAGQPVLVPSAASALAPGQYQVAVTFMDRLGRESGSTLAAVIDIAEGGGFELRDIPLPVAPDTTSVAVYVSGPNDQVLRQYVILPAGTRSAPVLSAGEGRALTTQFLRPLPPGHIVRGAHGRQFVACGQEVLWSEALRYGMFRPSANRMRFNAPIDLMEPIGDGLPDGAGLFVAAGARTYWYAGADPKDFSQVVARGSGAVPGSAMVVNGDVIGLQSAAPVLIWLARDGYFCIGLPGGQVQVLKKGEAVIDDADHAALLLRQQDGLSQLVAALRAPQGQSLAVTDRAVAHVIHRDP